MRVPNPSTILAAMSQPGPRDEGVRISACLPDELVPLPPQIDVELVANVSRSSSEGFLQLREVELRNNHHGVISDSYRYFLVERTRLDAVAVVLFRRRPPALPGADRGDEAVEIVLRSQLRPPLCFRPEYEVPLLAMGTGAVQWEIPAGLVEPGEHGLAGLFARASAEALEEVGVVLPPSRFQTLGLPTSLSPGLLAEKLHFVCAEILDTDEWRTARGDGHVVEQHSVSLFVPLSAALRSLAEGLVHDLKTEVGIFRLRQLMLSPSSALSSSEPR
ncbi:MAG: ADP-ribose pyrophosphatase [Myxococcaceae bacterium]|nr:ADP-ribose pyrophosphatase [Myxococcaceae bacterium]